MSADGTKTRFRLARPCVLLAVVTATGCYGLLPSSGGGQAQFTPPRRISAADIAVPAGYRIEAVATGLTFPTGVAFDAEGRPHVIEAGYAQGEVWRTPQLLRVEADRSLTQVAAGAKNGPWTGVAFAGGAFYIAEGGALEGGRILKVNADRSVFVLTQGLPTMGDHHTTGPAIGADGQVYFATGTATNSGVVGPDNAQFGWLKRRHDFHDVPCRDIKLVGRNYTSTDPIALGEAVASTGAFSPFGKPTQPGEVVRGRIPCSGAIFKIGATGGVPELVAWGFRSPSGLAFAPDGSLYVTENGYDDRGSRPLWGTPDVLWKIEPNTWYGWPDFSAAKPLASDDFRPPRGARPQFVLAEHPNAPPRPAAVLGVHSSSNGFDFARGGGFGYEGQVFIAQFGDQAPRTGKVMGPVGFKVVRVELAKGLVHDFAVNRGRANGPASKIGGGGLERPIAARFDPKGTALYVVDFGVMLETRQGPVPQPETGVLWRIARDAQP